MSTTALPKFHHSRKRALRRRLEAARALIEKGWAKQTLARRANGREVDFASPDACRFCADGALMRSLVDLGDLQVVVTEDPEWGPRYETPGLHRWDTKANSIYGDLKQVMHAAAKDIDPDRFSYIDLNDSSRNKARVLRMFDRAIELVS